MHDHHQLVIKLLGRQNYLPIWKAMQTFTDSRNEKTLDQVWIVEHNPVFTQGQAGKAEHLLAPGDIPVVQSDRGGQVTYHGPGQLVAYFLINLRRKNLGVRDLVNTLENIVIQTLKAYQIDSTARPDAPGVYVDQHKICSLGLRIRKGCSFHGLALNIDMDLSPFQRINPCGYQGMKMTQICDFFSFAPQASRVNIEASTHRLNESESHLLNMTTPFAIVEKQLIKEMVSLLSYQQITYDTTLEFDR